MKYNCFISYSIAIVCGLAALLGQALPAGAQGTVIVSATNPDQDLEMWKNPSSPFNIATANLLGIANVNCDMIEAGPGTEELYAIVWDGAISNNSVFASGFHVKHKNAPADVLELPLPGSGRTNANSPDIVVGNFQGPSAVEYYVGIVYEDGGDIYLERYAITWVTSTVATSVSAPIKLNTGASNCANPKIDLYADPSGYTSGPYEPLMHRFVAVWEENGAIMAVSDDLSTVTTSTTFSPTIIIGSGCTNPDVCASVDPTTTPAGEMAYVTFEGPGIGGTTNFVYTRSWDYTTNAVSGSTNMAANSYYPRIEAPTLAGTGVLWTAVYTTDNTGGGLTQYEVQTYSPTSGGTQANCFCLNTYLYGNINYSNLKPTVCGTGDFLGGGLASPGQDQTSVFFYSEKGIITGNTAVWTVTPPPSNYKGDYYVMGLDNNTAVMTTNMSGDYIYHQVNNTALSSIMTLTSGIDPALTAIANCSNSGYNMITVWNPGNAAVPVPLRYKLSGNSVSFKTASVNNLQKPAYRAYPNPADNYLSVEGAKNAAYNITNAIGQVIASGNIDAKSNYVNVNNLSTGVYLINLTENGYEQKIKFVKK